MSWSGSHERRELLKSRLWAAGLLICVPIVYLVVFLKIPAVPQEADIDVTFYIFLIGGCVLPTVAAPLQWYHVSMYRRRKSTRMSPAQLFTALSTIRMTLAAVVYLYGLVPRFLSGSLNRTLLFWVLGTAWAVTYWPRRSRFERFIKKVGGA